MIQGALLLNLLGIALALIPIVIVDLRIIMILIKGRVRLFDRCILEKFSPAIRSGLAMVWVSCVILGLLYAITSPNFLLQAKYLLNLCSAGVLTANAILVKKFFSHTVYRYLA